MTSSTQAVRRFAHALVLALTSLPARGVGAVEQRPKLALVCPQTCFEDYLRQRLSYFDVVRDRHQADFTLLIVRQLAAGGGLRSSVSLVQGDQGADPSLRLEVFSPKDATPSAQRRQLLDAALSLLHVALFPGRHAGAFRLSLPERTGLALSRLSDPWDRWVISGELSGTGEVQSEFYSVDMATTLTLRRITETDKLRLVGGASRRLTGFVLENGSKVHADVAGWDGRVVYARSLGKRFAAGTTFTAEGDEYENLSAHFHYGPVAEANLFPYSDNANAQLRVAYQAGIWANWYEEPTVFDELRELRLYHAVSVIADVNQPWGSVQVGTQLNSFIDRPKQLRLDGLAVLNLRLFEGFALTVEARAALIRDQIGLRKRNLTDVELLLATSELPSNFLVTGTVGFSYTFGSMHNTIVNPRFGQLDLEKE